MRGGDSASSGRDGSMSTVSKAEVVEREYFVAGMAEVSSRVGAGEVEELDLGLGLGTGPAARQGGRGEYCRILTAKDFPSGISSSSSSSPPAVVGVKRAADAVAQDVGSNSPTGNSVVGWPPIRAYRMNSLVQSKVCADDAAARTNCTTGKTSAPIGFVQNCENAVNDTGHPKSLFVKVNMDGMPIGRKVELTAHACYMSLAQALEDMFHEPAGFCVQDHKIEADRKSLSRLLDGSSEFLLTYEDKEGDWMLVGDVPWGMFLGTVRRLRIMRRSDANGLGKLLL